MDLVRLDRTKLPPEDHEAAEFIEANLMSLQSGADGFRWTVDFYLHIRELKRAGLDTWRKVAWTRIAGRNGAIEAYSFSMVMQLIAELLTPAMRLRMNMEKKRAATGLFAREFPQIAAIRNSTAHPGQLSGTPAEIAQHRLGGEGVYLSDFMSAEDDKLTLSASFKGRPASYELSADKADALAAAAGLYREAFGPLEDPTTVWWREQTR